MREAAERWTKGPLAARWIVAVAGFKLALHLLAANRYGYFRDELYFLDGARHLDWGYVDHAPLMAIYATLALALGGSLPVLRTIAALAGAGIVVLTMFIVAELGGGRYAQLFAGLCIVAAPMELAMASILSMNVFEPLYWMGCVLVLIRIIRTGDSRLWLWFGLLAGLGLENKHSTLFFGAAIAVALLLTPERREFLKPWIWIGGLIAVLLFLPNVLWQVAHDYPTLHDLRNVAASGKNVVLNPFEFLGQQVLVFHPLLFPVWVAGLVSLLFGRLRATRVLGAAFIVFMALMIVMKAKTYYAAPIYPMLFAAGGVSLEAWLDRRKSPAWLRRAIPAFVVVIAVVDALLVLPILPPERLVAFQRAMHVAPPKTEVAHEGPLEQRLGDQFGWPELVRDVARIYDSLPPGERAKTGIYASNYGEAGAINRFGPRLGLPPAICAHQTHSMWGPPADFHGTNLIWLQWKREWIEAHCDSVEKVGEHSHPWGMAEENRDIHLCRGLKRPLSEMWPDLTHWN